MTDANTNPESLAAFQQRFRDCFARREVWEQFCLCLSERLGETDNTKAPDGDRPPTKKCSARSRQRLLTDTVWDEEALRTRYHEVVRESLGDWDGIIVFVEAPFAKKGGGSAGAALQPVGRTGRLRNAQTGIFAIYVTRHGAVLVDARLFVPEPWFGDDRKEKREQCRFPEGLAYRSKSEIVLDMLARLQATGALPFRYAWVGPLAGSAATFIKSVDKGGQCFYFMPAPADAAVWVTKERTWTRRARYWFTWYFRKKRVRVVKKIHYTISPWSYMRTLPARAWSEQPVPGVLPEPVVEFARRRIAMSFGRKNSRWCWLLARRITGKRPVYTYYITNAHSRVRLAIFARLSTAGEAAERCLKDTIARAGLGRYAVRSWPSWHRHMMTAMMAHFYFSVTDFKSVTAQR
ncbi:MAG: transposase [Syntrophales bacterium]|nr:transposase [Syntrophales bacterium]